MDLLMVERVVLVNILVETGKRRTVVESTLYTGSTEFIISFIFLFYSYFQGDRENLFGGINYF